MIRVLLTVVLLSGASEAWSQTAAVRHAMRALEKEKWERSEAILQKALRKDSASSNIYFGFARYYFAVSNPAFDIDSAHSFIEYALATSRTGALKKRQGDPPDTTVLLDFRQRIDSAAFARARQEHSESSYNFFISNFPNAAQLDSSRLLRDEVSWQDAVAEDTPEAFAKYLEKYPASRYAGKARARHEELVFRINTKDQRLASFEAFLAEYPQSPYRHLVEEQIMTIYTADGDADKFSSFLRRYPQSRASRKARDILYHIIRETEPALASFSFWTDSLRHMQQINATFLAPFIANRKFGFMNASGKEVIAATSNSLYEGYRCGNILEDIVAHGNDIIARDGTVIYKGPVRELSDLGYGFIGIETPDCYHIMHKTGFTVGKGCASDARIIEGRFVAILSADGWAVYSLAGRLLTAGWEEVKSLGDIIALRNDGKWSLATIRQLGMVADQQPLQPISELDNVRAWSYDLIWVKMGNTEAVLDESLRVRIPFGEYELHREAFGIMSRSADCVKIISRDFTQSSCMDDVKFNSSWVCVKQNDKWSFYNPLNRTAKGSYDSIVFKGIFAEGYQADSVRVFLNDSTYLTFTETAISFIPGRDRGAFLQAERAGRKTVYDPTARKLFDGYYDRIQHAGGEYFIVSRREKKGLITSDGKTVLPIAYDAIGEIEGTRIPLLRSMRFGLYDVMTKEEIRPTYDKNILPYNKELLVAFRQGKSGMIDFNSRIHIPFQYDAFRFWNDTSALARQDNVWKIIDIGTNEVLVDDIHDYSIVTEANGESIIIIRQGSEFGVLSSTRGEVIPVSYTDLVNVGSARHPLYFTEKHVREASLSVVIYYDGNGIAVRHQALEPDDFDAIYCEEN